MKIKIHQTIVRSILCSLLVLLTLSFTALPGAAASRVSAPDFAAIDRYIEQEQQATRLPGLALGIVQGDQIVHLKGFGVADSAGRAVTAQTPFIIGSLTKSFTALAIMQLVEAGQIELDAPAQRYLPWFRLADAEVSARITVRQLLNQTSGLPEAASIPLALRPNTDDGALEREVRALQTVELTYPPGQTFQYCNLNYSILGLIVQTVAGESYEQYVQQHILAPLGMRNSYASPADAQRHDLATGHQFWFNRPIPTSPSYNRADVPAGYLSASAEDMAHYLIAQLNGGRYQERRILSAQGIATLHQPAVPAGSPDAFYGMGWATVELNGVPTVMHTGSTDAFRANMILVPQGQWGIVLLANGLNELQATRIGQISIGAMSLLIGRQPPPVPSYEVLELTILLVALGACVLQVLGIARSVVLLRRWRAQPDQRPRRAALVALRVGLPLALNLLWALLWLFVTLQVFATPLQLLVRSDYGLVVAVSGAVALIWGILRAVLAFAVLRAPATPKTTAQPATT